MKTGGSSHVSSKIKTALNLFDFVWGSCWNFVWLKIQKQLNMITSQNKKVQQKRHSSKYLSAFLQAIRHQSRHPG
jgi:hypothetical protein